MRGGVCLLITTEYTNTGVCLLVHIQLLSVINACSKPYYHANVIIFVAI